MQKILVGPVVEGAVMTRKVMLMVNDVKNFLLSQDAEKAEEGGLWHCQTVAYPIQSMIQSCYYSIVVVPDLL